MKNREKNIELKLDSMVTDLKSLMAEIEKINQKNKKLEEKNKSLKEKEASLLSRLSRVQDEKSVSLIDNEFSIEVQEKDDEIYNFKQDIDMKVKENTELIEAGLKLQSEIKILENQLQEASNSKQELQDLESEAELLKSENSLLTKVVYCLMNNPEILIKKKDPELELKSKEELEKIELDILEDLQKENKILTARADILRRQNEELHEFILSHFSIEKVNELYNLSYSK